MSADVLYEAPDLRELPLRRVTFAAAEVEAQVVGLRACKEPVPRRLVVALATLTNMAALARAAELARDNRETFDELQRMLEEADK